MPKPVQEFVKSYFELNIGQKKIVCPYFINLKKSKDLRVMVGKGTPEEIEIEARIWAKLKKVDLSAMSSKELRDFLIQRGIGIDCSGFVMHTLNFWHKYQTGKSIWKKVKPQGNNLFIKIAYFLKPIEKLGAEIITNKLNSRKIDINEVRPGDLIRSKWKRKNSHHVMLVSKVHFNNKEVAEIEYVASEEFYGEESGMRRGRIIIEKPGKPLENQKWIDNDKNGINHVYEGYLHILEDNGLRRLTAMQDIIDQEK